MFWGLIMEPSRCYSQTVKVSFRISMATLDVSTLKDDFVQVMCIYGGRNYLLCTLNKTPGAWQCPLDLTFEAGTKISFATFGNGIVHLTGYLTALDDDLDEEDVEEEELPVKRKRNIKTLEAPEPPKKKSKTVFSSKDSIKSKSSDSQAAPSSFNDVDEEQSLDSDLDNDGYIMKDEDVGDSEEESDEDLDKFVGKVGNKKLSGSDDTSEYEQKKKSKGKLQNGVNDLKRKSESKKAMNDSSSKKSLNKSLQKQFKEKPTDISTPPTTTVKGGVIIRDIKEGTGEVAKAGKYITVYYEGRFKQTNKMFDSLTKGNGFTFHLGKGEVVKGWDVGVVGMKVGGKRQIICPPTMAYGTKGSPPTIPPNSTLVFDVELKKVS